MWRPSTRICWRCSDDDEKKKKRRKGQQWLKNAKRNWSQKRIYFHLPTLNESNLECATRPASKKKKIAKIKIRIKVWTYFYRKEITRGRVQMRERERERERVREREKQRQRITNHYGSSLLYLPSFFNFFPFMENFLLYSESEWKNLLFFFAGPYVDFKLSLSTCRRLFPVPTFWPGLPWSSPSIFLFNFPSLMNFKEKKKKQSTHLSCWSSLACMGRGSSWPGWRPARLAWRPCWSRGWPRTSRCRWSADWGEGPEVLLRQTWPTFSGTMDQPRDDGQTERCKGKRRDVRGNVFCLLIQLPERCAEPINAHTVKLG